jgi:hypothetical protein
MTVRPRLLGIFSIFFLICVFSVHASAQAFEKQAGTTTGSNEKIFILPFRNDTDVRQYFNADIYKKIFFRSFYAYIGVIPLTGFDYIFTNETEVSASDVKAFAARERAKLVIYGSYRLTGYRSKPNINVEVIAYDPASDANIFRKTYEASTELEIFESINSMIADVMKNALKIDITNFVSINLQDFRIQKGSYSLYLNDRFISSLSNSSFSQTLKVIPEKNYGIILKNDSNNRIVMKKDVRMAPGSFTNITYSGYCTVKVETIKLKERMKNYNLYLDGLPVSENQVISNVSVEYPHSFLMTDNLNITNYTENFDLYDGQIEIIKPEGNGFRSLHFELLFLDYDMATLSLQYLPFNRYFWAAGDLGLSFILTNQSSSTFISPMIEAGYYLFGNSESLVHVGAGLILRANFVVTQGSNPPITSQGTPLLNYGIFINAAYSLFTVRPECYVYLDENGNVRFAFTAVLGICF